MTRGVNARAAPEPRHESSSQTAGTAASATFAQQGEETTVRVRSLVPFLVPAQQIPQAMHTALPGESSDVPRRLDYAEEAAAPEWVLELLAAATMSCKPSATIAAIRR